MANRSQRRLAWRQLSQYVPLTDNQAPPIADEPTLTEINPNDVPVGYPEFDMLMNGTGFVDGAVGLCNGSPLVTTFVSEIQLVAKFSGVGQVEGTVDISVRNPDGWESDPPVQFMFTAVAPPVVPAIFALSPNTCWIGHPDMSVQIFGNNFIAGVTTAVADDVVKNTLFLSDVVVQFDLPAADLAVGKTMRIEVSNDGGATVGDFRPFYVTGAGPDLPVVSSTDPASLVVGAADTPISVIGSFFDSDTHVKLNGVQQPTTAMSVTQLNTVVPAAMMATAGVVGVDVYNPSAGASNHIDVPVTVAAAAVPILDYISPTSSKLNPLVDLQLYCYCDASLTYHADMWVMIDDKRYEYDGSWNQQYLKVIVPKADLAVSGIRQVRVVDAAGESLPQPLTVEAAPALTLSSYSPNPIAASFAGGVTVTGTGFDATTEFYLDGGGFDPSSVVINTSTRATITAPSEWVAGGHVLTAYSDSLGQNSNELPVTVAAAPTLALTSYSPDPVPVGYTGVVTFTGAGFTDQCEFWLMTPNAVLGVGPNMAVPNSTTIEITDPTQWVAGTRGTYVHLAGVYTEVLDVTVAAAVVPTLPALTGLSPDTLPAGSMDWSMGVTGSGFIDGDTVYADGTALSTSFYGATWLNATMLASLMTVPKDIAITQRRGAETSPPLTFTVGPPLPVPAITSTNPASAVAGSSNLPLTVTGTGFDDQCQIKLNGSGKSTTFVSSTQLTAMIAASLMTTAGTNVAVTVNNPNAGLSNEVIIPVTAAPAMPTLTALTPNSAMVGDPDTIIGVSGTGFGDVAGAVVMLNGETPMATTYYSPTQLSFLMPANWMNNPATFQMSVVTAGGTSNSTPLTVAAPAPTVPVITSLAPNSLPVGSAQTTVVVTGTGFVAGSVVVAGGANMVTTYVSATQLSCIVPPAYFTVDGSLAFYVDNLDSTTSNVLYLTIRAARKTTRKKRK